MDKQMTDWRTDARMISKGIRLLSGMQPWLLPLTLLTALFSSAYPFANIYMSSLIIDELLTGRSIHTLMIYAVWTVGLNLLLYLMEKGLYQLKDIQSTLLYHNLDMVLNNKFLTMDYEHVEDSKVQLLRRRISESKNINGGGLSLLISNLENVGKSVFTIGISVSIVSKLFVTRPREVGSGLGGWLHSPLFSLLLILLIFFSTYFSLWMKRKYERKEFQLMESFISVNRLANFYIEHSINSYNAGKAIRLYAQKPLIEQQISTFVGGSNQTLKRFTREGAKYNAASSAFSALLGGMVYLFVGLKALVGDFSVGSVVKYTGSMNQFVNGFSNLMTTLSQLRMNNKYLQLYFDFLEIPDKKYHGTLPVEKRTDDEYELEFRNVSFTYPSTEQPVLKQVSLKLKIGERLAVVGMNGSGKTTFIKLLCRFYDPSEGEILLNGIDIRKYDYEEYMSLISVVFQDFKLFSFSLGQNVAASVDYDAERVRECLCEAGLKERLQAMPRGVDTPLYKEFEEDGVEISGGEAQKIALARALYKDAPIIVLDEPTAALDPLAEFEIYSKFNEIVGSKTAIYISHRLSSCRFCSNIVVFHEGAIIQHGNHDELVQDARGKYHELWHAQAQYYIEQPA